MDKRKIHHLWVGEKNLNSKDVLKATGLETPELININFYYNKIAEKLDEMIIIQVQDYIIAENMILKMDEMKIPTTANAMLDLILENDAEINGEQVGAILGMQYIGIFYSE